MLQLHDFVTFNRRTLRYTLGIALLIGGGIILAAKVWSGLHG